MPPEVKNQDRFAALTVNWVQRQIAEFRKTGNASPEFLRDLVFPSAKTLSTFDENFFTQKHELSGERVEIPHRNGKTRLVHFQKLEDFYKACGKHAAGCFRTGEDGQTAVVVSPSETDLKRVPASAKEARRSAEEYHEVVFHEDYHRIGFGEYFAEERAQKRTYADPRRRTTPEAIIVNVCRTYPVRAIARAALEFTNGRLNEDLLRLMPPRGATMRKASDDFVKFETSCNKHDADRKEGIPAPDSEAYQRFSDACASRPTIWTAAELRELQERTSSIPLKQDKIYREIYAGAKDYYLREAEVLYNSSPPSRLRSLDPFNVVERWERGKLSEEAGVKAEQLVDWLKSRNQR